MKLGTTLWLVLSLSAMTTIGCEVSQTGLHEVARTEEPAGTNPPDAAVDAENTDGRTTTVFVDAPVLRTDAAALPVDAAKPTMIPDARSAPVDGPSPPPAPEDAASPSNVGDPQVSVRFTARAAGWGQNNYPNGIAEFARNGNNFFSKAGGASGGRGFDVAVIDPSNGEAVGQVRNFDEWTTDGSLKDLVSYLRGLPSGLLVMIVACDDASLFDMDSCDLIKSAPVADTIETLQRLGSKEIDKTCFRSAWAFMAITGEGRALVEERSKGGKISVDFDLPLRR